MPKYFVIYQPAEQCKRTFEAKDDADAIEIGKELYATGIMPVDSNLDYVEEVDGPVFIELGRGEHWEEGCVIYLRDEYENGKKAIG